MANETRFYDKKARAAEEAGEDILNEARNAIPTRRFDRVTLWQITAESGVTVHTVIRRFGIKEELFEHLFEPLRRIVARGRQVHRDWMEMHCRNLFSELVGVERGHLICAAIVATDLNTWKTAPA